MKATTRRASVSRKPSRMTVRRKGKTVVVTLDGKRGVFSKDEWDGLVETAEILSDPKMMAAIRQGQRDLKAGRFYTWDEIRAELRLGPRKTEGGNHGENLPSLV